MNDLNDKLHSLSKMQADIPSKHIQNIMGIFTNIFMIIYVIIIIGSILLFEEPTYDYSPAECIFIACGKAVVLFLVWLLVFEGFFYILKFIHSKLIEKYHDLGG